MCSFFFSVFFLLGKMVVSFQGTSPEGQGKTTESGGASRFSRFGFGSQLLQKTVELVLRPRPGRQVLL